MSFTSYLIDWLLRLPPAETRDIVVTRNLPIAMSDGAILLADHYAPRSGPKRPTILIRTPYGRSGFYSSFSVLPYAERGFQVLIQSCRGTAGSQGEFISARNEHEDGLATLAWIKQQPWFSGKLAMIGGSYLGFVQWAVATDAGPELKALVPQITSADFGHFRFQGGSLTLETLLGWSTVMAAYASSGLGIRLLLGNPKRKRRLAQAYRHLPLREADRVVLGQPAQAFQEVMRHGPDDDYWQPTDYSASVAKVTTPVYLMGGWYDLFLDWQLKDYHALQAAGRRPFLLIGPWSHGEGASSGPMARETLRWLRAHFKQDAGLLRPQPVRLFVMGSNRWRNFANWPPPAQPMTWYLQPAGGLAPTLSVASEPDRYRYDPSDPTPSVGGNSLGLLAEEYRGAKDNRSLEARADVLVYTSDVLAQELEIIGPVTAELYIRSSLQHTDFFARLCVVELSGKSVNLCEGIVRLTPGSVAPEPDGSLHISIAVWPTAYHFRRGQRIRVQVSSGAHPRFVRNLGSEEPLATATKLLVADQAVYHDPAHPSAFTLPVLTW